MISFTSKIFHQKVDAQGHSDGRRHSVHQKVEVDILSPSYLARGRQWPHMTKNEITGALATNIKESQSWINDRSCTSQLHIGGGRESMAGTRQEASQCTLLKPGLGCLRHERSGLV